MKNKRVRIAMTRAGINQRQLAEILGTNDASVSIMLSRELSRAEQNDIIAKIEERAVESA